jgi:hypothetical protein
VFIEFVTDTEDQRFLAPHLFRMLEVEIAQWARINEIPFTNKYYKNTYRLAFDDDKHYTVFRLTWIDLPYINYKIIDNKW